MSVCLSFRFLVFSSKQRTWTALSVFWLFCVFPFSKYIINHALCLPSYPFSSHNKILKPIIKKFLFYELTSTYWTDKFIIQFSAFTCQHLLRHDASRKDIKNYKCFSFQLPIRDVIVRVFVVEMTMKGEIKSIWPLSKQSKIKCRTKNVDCLFELNVKLNSKRQSNPKRLEICI
jgi:hypothetical protein